MIEPIPPYDYPPGTKLVSGPTLIMILLAAALWWWTSSHYGGPEVNCEDMDGHAVCTPDPASDPRLDR